MTYWTAIAALFGATAVATGAFGAHALKKRLDDHKLNAWNTGASYQLTHALALLALSLSPHQQEGTMVMGLWSAGILLFSGSLYLLALTGKRIFGPVTPLGGLVMMAGWGLLAVKAFLGAAG